MSAATAPPEEFDLCELPGVRPNRRLIAALVAVLVSWVPLVILSAMRGQLIGPTANDFFLTDPGPTCRYLIALPLVLLAPAFATPRLSRVIRHLQERDLIPSTHTAAFRKLVGSTLRLSRSWAWRIPPFILAAAMAATSFGLLSTRPQEGWRAAAGEPPHPSLAGYWLAVVSQPMLTYLMLRFVFRLGLWWRLMAGIARLPLAIQPAHPDHMGGLGFFRVALKAFNPYLLAVAISLAGPAARLVLAGEASIIKNRELLILLAVVGTLAVVGPYLIFFWRPLRRARIDAIFEYGDLAAQQLRRMDTDWMKSGAAPRDDLNTVPDFSAVTDFGSIVERVHSMNNFLVTRLDLLSVVAVILLPFLPVALLEVPWSELVSQLRGIV